MMNVPPNKSWPADKVERRAVAKLIPYAKNARIHSLQQIEQIAASIKRFGFTIPVLIDGRGNIIAGHGRVLAAKLVGLDEVPVMVAKGWSDAERRAYVIADNKLALNSAWDADLLRSEIADLAAANFDATSLGFLSDELDAILRPETGDSETSAASGKLAERFGIPPFSVLNAREGWWQDRKRAWIDLGIRSELGRGEGATDGVADGVTEPGLNHYRNRNNAAPGGSPRHLDRGWTGKKDKTAHG